MMDMFNILTDVNCDSINEAFGAIIKGVVGLIKIGVPIILIVMGMLDLGKAVTSQKEDEMKKAQSLLIKRCIYAVLVFLIGTAVPIVLGWFVSDETTLGCVTTIMGG